MSKNSVIVLYYSNGIDVFGPIHKDDFSKNKYYKSTLIWYEGLDNWIPIDECEEFKHLIGSMPTPLLNSAALLAKDDISPPLSKKATVTQSSGFRNKAIYFVIIALLLLLSAYLLNMNTEMNSSPIPVSDTTLTDSAEASIIKETEIEVEKKTYRINWTKFINVTTNDFKKNEIGGIKDLKVFLNNNTPYGLDSVKVKVDYIKSNGEVYQTETMRFDLVLAKNKKELFAPNSKRGVDVKCRIVAVYSSEMEFCYQQSKVESEMKSEDPYRCP